MISLIIAVASLVILTGCSSNNETAKVDKDVINGNDNANSVNNVNEISGQESKDNTLTSNAEVIPVNLDNSSIKEDINDINTVDNEINEMEELLATI